LPSSFFQMMANGLNRWLSDRKLPKDWQDTGTGAPCLGSAARHGFADDTQDCSSRPREL
jgi:hypothetical protein